jgi:alpha-beta hydrolase superfamily lysophospholipase
MASEGEITRFRGPNEWSLAIRHWKHPRATATVVGLHGYSEHSGCYSHVAEFFNKKNVDVIWLDLPGHGLSEGPRSDIDRFEDYVRSFELFFSEVKTRGCPGPYWLFAHSLGGLVATRFLQTSPLAPEFSRALLSSPLFGLSNYPPNWLPLLRVVTNILPNISWQNDSELGPGVLTHDKAMTAKRTADPLIKSRVTIHFVREMLRARVEAFRDVELLKIPMGLFQAGVDRVTRRSEAERFFSLLNVEKKVTIYEDLYHEIVNEVSREKVLADMATWLQIA